MDASRKAFRLTEIAKLTGLEVPEIKRILARDTGRWTRGFVGVTLDRVFGNLRDAEIKLQEENGLRTAADYDQLVVDYGIEAVRRWANAAQRDRGTAGRMHYRLCGAVERARYGAGEIRE